MLDVLLSSITVHLKSIKLLIHTLLDNMLITMNNPLIRIGITVILYELLYEVVFMQILAYKSAV